jgi:hypothetical protein
VTQRESRNVILFAANGNVQHLSESSTAFWAITLSDKGCWNYS